MSNPTPVEPLVALQAFWQRRLDEARIANERAVSEMEIIL
jgi:hypothetical protein